MNQEEITYSQEVTKALNIAQKIGRENLNANYTGAHLLKAMLNRDLSLLKYLENLGIDVFYLEEWAEVRIEELPKSPNKYSCEPDEVIDEIFAEADQIREILQEQEISLFAVITAISSPGVAFTFDQMKTFPVTRNELLKDINLFGDDQMTENTLQAKKTNKGFIQKYCINIKEKVKKKNRKELLVGRDTEINTITEILCRYSKQNVLIMGDHGVGKTALIEGFVQKVILKQIPDILGGMEIFELDMGALIAGASYKGEIEDRIKNIAQEMKAIPKSVLIIEEFHSLFGNHGSDSGIINLLKSELSNGLTLIATSTVEEYTKKIEKEQGLAGMFELLKLVETTDEIHFRMLKQTLEDYQIHHKISIDDQTMREAIRLSQRYMKEKSLPASAIDLIDHTMSVLKTAGESFLKERNHLVTRIIHLEDNTNNYAEHERKMHADWLLKDLIQKTKYLISTAENSEQEKELPGFDDTETLLSYSRNLIEKTEKIAQEKRTNITDFDLALIISQKTNIPIGKLKEEEKQRLNEMESVLAKRVVGQDHAITIVSEAVLETRSGLSKAGQPIGSFFFLGPTGTGKTELAKSLAEFLFQDENAIIRFDMSEFKEEHSAALLYGAPPGYVGYEDGGLLVNKIRQKPYSIVLFDEIEKAHSSVFDVFLQIMDEGKLHDRLGKEGDFSNAIILFTSNIGSDFIVESFGKGEIPQSSKLLEMMSRFFRPEFLGRLTETIPFAPISKDNALKIFEIHLKKELLDLAKGLSIDLIITEEVKKQLSTEGYDIKYGARPLKGVIRGRLRRPLAKKIVSGEFKEGDRIEVSLLDDELIWTKI
ncbi:ATP-dependent Clp protease ATP-binding subunit [Chryseobacterium wangxinyae]|uniref:AAA family ATPase n=1 Tax=Chryseobacterium sp. CY350 TaxID=2997336 RepID=UPI0022702E71|nr:ATP-dependent Clp protease ATP-binding subunit [Chryseobacterium sp. CY350]MCY0977807.1 ATP-dependent Clp protease ATP-binding subunit [Chryseobacterium sp. CY350]WBZ94895.1 ATP-dependent Clp protease ATP-binding subunit [Chryseobacterium sp. CY350]